MLLKRLKSKLKKCKVNKADMASNVDLVYHKSKKGLKPADRKSATIIKDCKYCGGSHLQGKCPTYPKSVIFALKLK